MTTINAFHPDYVKTYHPELLTSIKSEAAAQARGVISGTIGRERKEAKNKFANTTNVERVLAKNERKKELDAKKRKMLERTTFHIYSKAGDAKKK